MAEVSAAFGVGESKRVEGEPHQHTVQKKALVAEQGRLAQNVSWGTRSRRSFIGSERHVEEGLAGGGAGVDRLLRRAQCDASALQFVDNVLQVLQRPRETIAGRVC